MDKNKQNRRGPAFFAKLGVAAASALIAIVCAEFGVRLFSSQGFSLLVKDAVVGQRYRPGFQHTAFVPEAGRKVTLRFNQLGYRGEDRPTEKKTNVRRVAVLGDSFVAAVAVDERDTLTSLLEEYLNHIQPDISWEVLNFGVSGNSTGQGLLTWRNFAKQFQPDLVLMCFYNGNDLAENMPGISTAHRPYFHLDDDGNLQLINVSEGRASLSRWLGENSQLYVWQKHRIRILRDQFRTSVNVLPPGFQILNSQPPQQFVQAWEVTSAILKTLDEEVRSTGADFVLASIPAHEQIYESRWRQLLETAGSDSAKQFDPDFPERKLSQICQQHGIRFLPLVHAFRQSKDENLHFQSEGHWTERGNELAAETVLDYLVTRQVAGVGVSSKASTIRR